MYAGTASSVIFDLVVSGSSSYLCAVTDEDGLVQIFDTRPTVMARDAARVKCKQTPLCCIILVCILTAVSVYYDNYHPQHSR